MSIDPTVTAAALGALESALNAALALDQETLKRLGILEGRVIAVELTAPALTLYIAPTAEGLRLMGYFDGVPDTTLKGSALALARLAATPRGTPAAVMFNGEVTLRGDLDTGRRFQEVLAALDLDLEEHLARLTGDAIAHQVGNWARGFAAWGRQAATALERNVVDYVQEEARLLPSRSETEDFAATVETLRETADRLEARLKHLRTRLEPGA